VRNFTKIGSAKLELHAGEALTLNPIYVKKCSLYIQCKGDVVVVDIKQHKSPQFNNSNFTVTQSAKFF